MRFVWNAFLCGKNISTEKFSVLQKDFSSTEPDKDCDMKLSFVNIPVILFTLLK